MQHDIVLYICYLLQLKIHTLNSSIGQVKQESLSPRTNPQERGEVRIDEDLHLLYLALPPNER
jgi:hypothetical protein